MNGAANNGDRKSQAKLTRWMATARTILVLSLMIEAYAGEIGDGKVDKLNGLTHECGSFLTEPSFMAAIGSAHGKAGLSTEREQFANAQQQSNKDKI